MPECRVRSHCTVPVTVSTGTVSAISPRIRPSTAAPCPVCSIITISLARSQAVGAAEDSTAPVPGSMSAVPPVVVRVKTSLGSSAEGKESDRKVLTGVSAKSGICAGSSRASPCVAVAGAGSVPSSGKSEKVEAVIQSAVSDDSINPPTAKRASSTCTRPGQGPRVRPNQCRQPPIRRATRAAPDTVSNSIPAAPAAITSRPVSSRNSERCRLTSQRSPGIGSAEPASAPLAGSITALPGTPPSNHQAVIRPEGARRICSSPGWAAPTRAASSATVNPDCACGAPMRSSAG